MKFIRGKLTFYVSIDNFDNFVAEYQQDNRGLTEQVLNLSCAEKYKMRDLLRENMRPENKFYKYDFTFDNCTTRLRDLVENATDSTVHFGTPVTSRASFRDFIYEYLDANDKQWSKLGIDILLGSRMDVAMTPRQEMFLPDYLMKAFDSSSLDGRPLVIEKRNLFKTKYTGDKKNNLTHPIFLFTCLFVLIAFLSFSKSPFIQGLLISFDGFLYFVIGLLGVLLIFMWLGTNHFMCKDNYNLLWAWPTNVIAAFYVHSKKKVAKIYILAYAIFNLVLLAAWAFLPQHLNPSLIPIILILILRSFISVSRKKK